MASGKTAGIVLGILLPILIFCAFLLLWCRKVNKEDEQPEVFYTDKLTAGGGVGAKGAGIGSSSTDPSYRRSSSSYPNETSVIAPSVNRPIPQTSTTTPLQSAAPPPPPPPVTTGVPKGSSIEMVTMTPTMENIPVLEGSPRSSRSSLSRGSSRTTNASSTGENGSRGKRRKNSGSGGRRGSRGTPMTPTTPVGISNVAPNIPTSAIPSTSKAPTGQPQPESSPNQEYDGVYYTGEPIPGRPDHIEFRDEVNDGPGPRGAYGPSLASGLPRRQDSSTSSDNRSYVSSTIAV